MHGRGLVLRVAFTGGVVVAEGRDAVHLARHMRVPVKNERSRVRVRSHVSEYEPVTDLGTLQHRVLLVANLVKAIASRAENSRRKQLVWDHLLGLVEGRREGFRNGVEVVIDHVVEGAVDPIVNVQGLLLALATPLARVHLGGNCRGATYKVPPRLSNKAQCSWSYHIN